MVLARGYPGCEACRQSSAGVCALHGSYMLTTGTGTVPADPQPVPPAPCALCPVCLGRGFVPRGFYHRPDDPPERLRDGRGLTETCRGCQGRGIVWRY